MTTHPSNNRQTGSSTFVSFADQEINGEMRNFDSSETQDLVESTAGSEQAKSYIPEKDDATFSLETTQVVAAGSPSPRNVLYRGNRGTLEYGTEGTATGAPKYQCLAIVANLDRAQPYDDLAMLSAELQRDGDWIAHYELLGSVYA